MTYYPVKFQPKYQNTNTNLRLLHLRSKIRRLVRVQEFQFSFWSNFLAFLEPLLVTEYSDTPVELTPPLTPPDGEKYRKSRRWSELFLVFSVIFYFSNEPKSPVVKPQKEGDIWDRIGHTAPNPIVNGEVSQFTEFPQLPEFRRLTAPF